MTLDPENWDDFRKAAHRMLDASIDTLEGAKDGPVWTQVPDTIQKRFNASSPTDPQPIQSVQAELEGLLPYNVGNTHPRFFGWVHGAGSPSGLIADMAAGAMNVNAGGRDHISPLMERQVIEWSADMMGLPKSTSGLIVSGTSMATIIALKVARDQAMQSAQSSGTSEGQLIGYTSEQTHSCVARAFDLLGLGKDNLRQIGCNENFEIDLGALESAIVKDQQFGLQPFAIIGTAGAVNMGAIDDLEGIADIAVKHKLWFHVDGAFGASANIGRHASQRLTGLSRADSLAFDFHKWLQVNYEAGCVLIQNEAAHRASFSDRPDYLRGSARGLAGGAFWAVDYGPELSRSFRALKVWTHFKTYGVKALSSIIDRNIEQAQYLESVVKGSSKLEMLAPVPLNICCFRYKFDADRNDALNDELCVRLQESGIAVTSTTRIKGALALRVNITNHRTTQQDLDILVGAIETIGATLGQS